MEIKISHAGYCHNIERITIKGGKWKNIKFPAMFALIKHPKLGFILYDTGYSSAFFEQTKKFPYSIYGAITPVHCSKDDEAVSQLEKLGILPDDIRYIIISHFHADHISGLRSFPNSTFICSRKGYESIKHKKGLSALKEAFIPNLLPNDFDNRVIFFEDSPVSTITCKGVHEFYPVGYDLFSDNSIKAILLEGHADKQYGILLQNEFGEDVFFIADATWSSEAYRELKYPHSLAKLIMHDKSSYYNNLNNIHLISKKNPSIHIIPSHCIEYFKGE